MNKFSHHKQKVHANHTIRKRKTISVNINLNLTIYPLIELDN